MRFVYHRDYAQEMPFVPLDPRRAERILAFLSEEGLVQEADISVPRRASLNNLLLVHAPEYIESLQRPEVVGRILGAPMAGADVEPVLDLQRRMVGGTIQASRLALMTGGIGVNLGGGFHHALPDQGMGFCIFNDIAIAVARLRARGFKAPMLVIDLDLHDGNGTRAVFAQDPTVHTYSVHNADWGDTDVVASTAIALGDDVTDEVYLGTLLKTLPGVVEEVDPGLVIYLAGTDVAAGDKLGNWRISAEGLLRRDQFVMELMRHDRRSVPTVVVLGGGYGDRAWRYSARFLYWLLTGRSVEPPDNEELVLMRLRRLTRQLDPSELTLEPGGFEWRLTDDDLVGIVPGIPKQTRFLGYLSRSGVELLLERLGIFAELRARGFNNPVADLDLTHPLGHTLRLWSDPRRSELLLELRANRSQRAAPGMEVMALEWLLLQNPRARFSDDRPPLPGQQYPGLGILKEVLGWLVMVAEMVGLDGIYYVPSHFHVAAQSRKLVRFLEPEHEARFRALQAVLADVPLAEATVLVDEGRVVNLESGEPVPWEGCPMVLPASDRLRELVFSEEYERRVDEAAAGLRFAVADTVAGAPRS